MATRFGRKNPIDGVKSYAGVIWGQPEGNCPKMPKAIKCDQFHFSLRAEKNGNKHNCFFVILLIKPIGVLEKHAGLGMEVAATLTFKHFPLGCQEAADDMTTLYNFINEFENFKFSCHMWVQLCKIHSNKYTSLLLCQRFMRFY